MIYLSMEQVVEIHDVLLKKYGGKEGTGHRGLNYEGVQAAVRAVENSHYETPKELAAAYAVYIVQGHVFQDGNKRAGSGALLTFLHLNDIPVRISSSKLMRLMVTLQTQSESGVKTTELVSWLAARL